MEWVTILRQDLRTDGPKLLLVILTIISIMLVIHQRYQARFQLQMALKNDLVEQHRIAQRKLYAAQRAREDKNQHEYLYLQYAAWRADVELLDFAATFDAGVTQLGRDKSEVVFSRDFYSHDSDGLNTTKMAVRQMLYWRFDRLSIDSDEQFKHAHWRLVPTWNKRDASS